jgi:hypothetical protein
MDEGKARAIEAKDWVPRPVYSLRTPRWSPFPKLSSAYNDYSRLKQLNSVNRKQAVVPHSRTRFAFERCIACADWFVPRVVLLPFC